jgi:hypothetical protein
LGPRQWNAIQDVDGSPGVTKLFQQGKQVLQLGDGGYNELDVLVVLANLQASPFPGLDTV